MKVAGRAAQPPAVEEADRGRQHDPRLLFRNTRRRESALGMRTPAEVEADWFTDSYQRDRAKTATTKDEVQPLAAGLVGS